MSSRAESGSLEELDVAVMGAGFSGLYQLYKLRQLGLRVRVFESGSAIGGTWYWNRYPGARVDTSSNLYQYSDESLWREWKFLDQYPSYKEIRDYFAFVDRKWDLSKDIRLNAKSRMRNSTPSVTNGSSQSTVAPPFAHASSSPAPGLHHGPTRPIFRACPILAVSCTTRRGGQRKA